jgi:hypothetical protein
VVRGLLRAVVEECESIFLSRFAMKRFVRTGRKDEDAKEEWEEWEEEWKHGEMN